LRIADPVHDAAADLAVDQQRVISRPQSWATT